MIKIISGGYEILSGFMLIVYYCILCTELNQKIKSLKNLKSMMIKIEPFP